MAEDRFSEVVSGLLDAHAPAPAIAFLVNRCMQGHSLCCGTVALLAVLESMLAEEWDEPATRDRLIVAGEAILAAARTATAPPAAPTKH